MERYQLLSAHVQGGHQRKGFCWESAGWARMGPGTDAHAHCRLAAGGGCTGKGAGSSGLPRWHIFLEKGRVRLQRIETRRSGILNLRTQVFGWGGRGCVGGFEIGWGSASRQSGREDVQWVCLLTQAFSPSGSALARADLRHV